MQPAAKHANRGNNTTQRRNVATSLPKTHHRSIMHTYNVCKEKCVGLSFVALPTLLYSTNVFMKTNYHLIPLALYAIEHCSPPHPLSDKPRLQR